MGGRQHHEARAYPERQLGLGVLGLLGRGVQVFAQGCLKLVHRRDAVRDDLGQRVAWLSSAGQLHGSLWPEGCVIVVVAARSSAEGLAGGIFIRAHIRLSVRIARVHSKWDLTRILGAELESVDANRGG